MTISVDLAQSVFQVHAIGVDGEMPMRRQVRRAEAWTLFSSLPPCLVEMEACASAHRWSPELLALGYKMRLMPSAYVKRCEANATDVEAVCEAVTRPTMRCDAVKKFAQQPVLMFRRTRDLRMCHQTPGMTEEA